MERDGIDPASVGYTVIECHGLRRQMKVSGCWPRESSGVVDDFSTGIRVTATVLRRTPLCLSAVAQHAHSKYANGSSGSTETVLRPRCSDCVRRSGHARGLQLVGGPRVSERDRSTLHDFGPMIRLVRPGQLDPSALLVRTSLLLVFLC